MLFSSCLRSFYHFWCTLDEKNRSYLYRLGRQSYRLLEISLTCLPNLNGNAFFGGERNSLSRSLSHEAAEDIFFLLESDIIHLNFAGMSFIVLNTVKTANDLLDKRSSIYYPILVPLVSPFLPKAFSKRKAEWSDLISRFQKYNTTR